MMYHRNMLKRIGRFVLILGGAMLYLIALAYLYTRPEVRAFLPCIAPVPITADTGGAGCQQKQVNLSEQALREQLERNWQTVQKEVKR